MRHILLAIPTAKYIESETFKSIYDLDVPADVEITYQHFYGYNIDQVRNLIASDQWAGHVYFDYLFAVDSDIVLPRDALTKLLAHNVDIVAGVYNQRFDKPSIEIYRKAAGGGIGRINMTDILPPGLHQVDGVGFGCVLVKSDVLRKIGYPQFTYHSALDHKNTVSEDTDFCIKAAARGFKLYVDSSLQCDHRGMTTYKIPAVTPTFPPPEPVIGVTGSDPSGILTFAIEKREQLRALGKRDLLPKSHSSYIKHIRDDLGVQPKVIYDIGACVLHWTNTIKQIWPNAEYIALEAMDACEFLYQEAGMRYHMGVLGDEGGREVDFYQNVDNPGGNSRFKENIQFSPEADTLFSEQHIVKKTMQTLDDVIALHHFPLPDLIKMDVQGSEWAILKGAKNALKHCDHLILELQHQNYNIGAPLFGEVVEWLDKKRGFELVSKFSVTPVDGDYHFRKKS